LDSGYDVAMPPRSRPGPLKLVVFSLLPVIVLLVVGEAGARVYFALRNRAASYLVAPYGMARSYPFRIGATWTRHDHCTGRTLTLQSHDLGGRGPDWPRSKPSGTLRVIAAGGSSTFGINNPYEGTWPVLLERRLRAALGRPVDVLNAGQPGRRLEHIVAQLPAWMARAQPDAVLYYEGYNNAYPYDIGRFHEGPGRLLYGLYYSSMLYTYLVEKVNLAGATWEQTFAKEMALFRAQLPRFVTRVRKSGATPVFVLQVTDPLPAGPLDTLPIDDHAAVVAHIRRATTGRRSLTNAQAGVLIELVRRAGQELSVPVIDPRPVFAAPPEHRTLFCSEVHLTDAGNQVLAEAIAVQLAPQLTPEGAAARTK
jgi:lysophospholipase L1-like esterase